MEPAEVTPCLEIVLANHKIGASTAVYVYIEQPFVIITSIATLGCTFTHWE